MSGHAAADAFANDLANVILAGFVLLLAASAFLGHRRNRASTHPCRATRRVPGSVHRASPPSSAPERLVETDAEYLRRRVNACDECRRRTESSKGDTK